MPASFPMTSVTDAARRRYGDHPRVTDAVVAAALFACSFPGSVITLPGDDLQVPWWPGVLLTGVSCAVLMWCRRRPRIAVAVTFVCATAIALLGYLLTVLLLGPLMVALYSLAVGTNRRTANTFAFTGIAVLTATEALAGPAGEPPLFKLLGPAAWLLLPTSLGTMTRLRAAYLDAERARAEHAERTREEEARRRVVEERMRIARDLHDVVAHHLVLANLQAGAVTRALHARPDEAERTAAALAGSTSSALRELRATVGLLRHHTDEPGGTAGSADTPPEPTPGLDRLPELAASFGDAGLAVTVITEGDPRPLSVGTDLTAYRIVQEALTNVTKHAATHTAEVRLVHSPHLLTVTVTNGGDAKPASPTADCGYGLVGMRERVRSAGGHIRMGHRSQGGFEVVTELPVQSPASGATEPI
ncbi:histidine kinase [Streptomyces sp. NBC_00287]|uniref:sensor histidine kinase n=1 Tax=Streptomyces sp. NBC_00287 TaxID=2975702 RepID=UPI002E27E469|nr:histidine kinase [Streptomyces sp. NBC_00287]